MQTRTVKVKGWAVPLQVPMYIQRLDSEHVEGWTRNAGWQVRYQRPWRYFADSGLPPGKRTGRRGSPQESLKRATEYLLKIYQGQRGKLRASEARRKRDKLGVPGVRAVIKKSTKRNLLEYYVEVGPIPAVRRVPRRFYVGTENTITRERYDRAWARAVAFRRELEKQYRKCLRTR